MPVCHRASDPATGNEESSENREENQQAPDDSKVVRTYEYPEGQRL
jgi:hypothetical protein